MSPYHTFSITSADRSAIFLEAISTMRAEYDLVLAENRVLRESQRPVPGSRHPEELRIAGVLGGVTTGLRDMTHQQLYIFILSCII